MGTRQYKVPERLTKKDFLNSVKRFSIAESPPFSLGQYSRYMTQKRTIACISWVMVLFPVIWV